ncbi:MAG: helix-turn-helix domain-containing protein [Cytophagaceae bacterium]|nr:helix-turn-helix domain-containing protein [Cytophagaceae bacterium]MBL0301753.1 helix-turn-helix domain-containing protein [Cytophagaceae bacterium]
MSDITREITPLTPFDCFTIFKREKTEFDFPLHFHEEFELNFILNGKGVKRTIGDHSEEIGCIELVLIGSNLPHFWQTNNFEPKDQNDKITEVTIQFHKDLLEEKFLQRNQLFFINNLFQKASKGILFSEETANNLKEKIINLPNKTGFHSVLDFFSILHELSTAPSMRLLSSATFVENPINYHSRRLEKTFDYIRKNFHKEITLDEISKLNGMTLVSFSRFIKKRTGKTFIDSLNDIRLGYATRLLIDSTESISEIAYKCGYNNISYFNRLFKSKKKLTPKEFRDNYSGSRTFV